MFGYQQKQNSLDCIGRRHSAVYDIRYGGVNVLYPEMVDGICAANGLDWVSELVRTSYKQVNSNIRRKFELFIHFWVDESRLIITRWGISIEIKEKRDGIDCSNYGKK